MLKEYPKFLVKKSDLNHIFKYLRQLDYYRVTSDTGDIISDAAMTLGTEGVFLEKNLPDDHIKFIISCYNIRTEKGKCESSKRNVIYYPGYIEGVISESIYRDIHDKLEGRTIDYLEDVNSKDFKLVKEILSDYSLLQLCPFQVPNADSFLMSYSNNLGVDFRELGGED